MNTPLRCGPGRQPCPNPHLCGENCHFTTAGLNTRDGGQQVDGGIAVDFFDSLPRKYIWIAVAAVAAAVPASCAVVHWVTKS